MQWQQNEQVCLVRAVSTESFNRVLDLFFVIFPYLCLDNQSSQLISNTGIGNSHRLMEVDQVDPWVYGTTTIGPADIMKQKICGCIAI